MFDLAALHAAVNVHTRVARLVVASTAGSVPREVGAAMLVWTGGQSGTIGGGALEFEAVARARAALANGDRLDKIPLGPDLGQCCGGAVMILTEVWEAKRLQTVSGDAFVRPMPGYPQEMPMKVAGRLRQARNGSRDFVTEQHQGWLIEPIARPHRHLWVWGAGHVGRAIVATLAPLPGLAITWVDVARDRFPDAPPEGVRVLPCPDPAKGIILCQPQDDHLILTYSHALDLDLCHRLLGHGFASLGLIGSATKRARFRSRLAQLGHSGASIARIQCPIGDPSLGKHPQAIAIGVAMELLAKSNTKASRQEIAG